MEPHEMEQLQAKREVMFAKVKWELSVAENLPSREATYEEVQERRDKLSELAGSFEATQTAIEENTDNLEDVASVFNYRIQFDEVYYKVKGIYSRFLAEHERMADHVSTFSVRSGESNNDLRDAIRALIETQQTMLTNQIRNNAAPTSGQASNQDHPLNVKLPQLNIPVFNGERKNWHPFKDLFVNSIHSRTDLKDSLKMQYLLSYLDGEAKKMVSSFPISDANYREAWETLVSHYNKKKYTVFALVREFIDQPATSSASGLKKLVTTSDDVIRQLKALGNEYESRDPWLIHLLLEKVDKETRSLWAQKIIDVDSPTFADFLEFLQRRCDALETCTAFTKRPTHGDTGRKESTKPHVGEKVQAFHTSTSSSSSCSKCSKDHPVYHCEEFKALDITARKELAQTARLCFNCLRPSHSAKKCQSKSVCHSQGCGQRHHTLLCTKEAKQPEKKQVQDQADQEAGSESTVASVNVNSAQAPGEKCEITLLPTVVARIKGADGKLHEVRILIDCGSQVSLITEACVKRLGLRRSNATLEVTGVNAEVVGTTSGKVTLVMSSRFEEGEKLVAQAYVLGKLTATLPCQRFNVSNMPYLEGLQLADPKFNQPGTTDVILGSDLFLSILKPGQVKDHNGNPVAQRSVFGWMVAGKISKQGCAHTYHSVINLNQEVDIDRTLRLFWEDQALHSPKQLTKEEERVVETFNSTLTRSNEGRFIVRLPMDDSKLKLGNSLATAIHWLKIMERRFEHDSNFKQRYISFMQEYQQLGHMEEVPPDEIVVDCTKSYYLPHHGVVKEDSKTTKLRVVCNGSSATTTGTSLNDILLDAPNITADLFEVLLRFRMFVVVFIADIEKMYRQVLVHPDDLDYLRIVWRESPDMAIKHFRLCTVTYGLKNSGFLAMAALHKAADEFEQQYPEAAERIKKHTYVDDLTSGADSVEDAKRIIKEINEILGKAGFTLRKWSSNSSEVLDSLTDTINTAMPIQFPDERDIVKALGTHWLPIEDVFTFKVTMPTDGPNTKHQLLSDSAKLFDPFGWFAPVIVRVKILYQQCWLYDLNWHDPLPPVIEEVWTETKENLHQLEQVKIPRWAANYNGRIELHGFSDASEEAYAAVVYLRSIDDNGEAHVTLLAAKTKVAPVRQISIPRLELNAAELLAKLMKQVADPLQKFQIEQYAWTDSTIVLQWLSSHPRKWNTYIANRTSSILDILPRKHWAHVVSSENPADCASRGISPQELANHPLWWTGPAWLSDDSVTWKRNIPDEQHDEQTLEVRKRFQSLNVTVSLPATSNVIEKQILEQRSDLHTACWQLARVRRFVFNVMCKITGEDKQPGPILPSELHQARMQFARLAQQECFASEIKSLVRGQEVPVKSSISGLYPFLDGTGTLRVGGRLQNSAFSYEVKHPIIVPKNHRFAKLLVKEIHVNNCHAGPTLMTATVNQRYWIQGCQTIMKQVVDDCVTCCRNKAQTAKQLMGSMPASRVTACRPFVRAGVDYAGPILVRCSNTRGVKSMKGYIVVFVCLSTKAIHLEVAGDLSTDTFLGAFKRMIARRGFCNEMWSDNGTNLAGADRQLQEIYDVVTKHANQQQHFFTNLGIRWNFIPPASPHQGGIWEAAVKSAKQLLRPIVGNEKLTFEELSTVLCQVEACLNSRPLCPISSNPDSLEALTPGHSLVGQPLNLLPEPDVTHLKMNQLDRWQRVQRYTADFWQRWRDEYLATLQPRGKWKTSQDNLKPGQLVIVKNDNSPPSAWELARIVAVHPDQRGLVRTVTLRRGKSEYQRPVQKLCPLPD